MRGRIPKPIGLQIAQGDPRKIGKKKLQEALAQQPQGERGLPPCPKRLKGTAREMWTFCGEQIAQMNIDHRPDAVMLEGLCVAFARATQADALIAENGLVIEEPVTDREGKILRYKVKTHPAVGVSMESWAEVRRFCVEFGFSPASVTRVKADKPEQNAAEELAAVLAAPRVKKPTRIAPMPSSMIPAPSVPPTDSIQ